MAEAESIRILIADDHELLRMGIRILLTTYPDIELLGEARNGREAVEMTLQLRPHVVLMDLLMPEIGGIAATRMIRERQPDTQVIVLTTFETSELVSDALHAGAVSYVLKNVSSEELILAIRDAVHGKTHISPAAMQALLTATHAPAGARVDLTRREEEVLQLLVQGFSNTRIAKHLSISVFTVKRHVSNILHKLDAESRTEAVAVALERKLIR